jgi:hypothetical protein
VVNEKCKKQFWSESLNGIDHLRDMVVDRGIILKWFLEKRGVKV